MSDTQMLEINLEINIWIGQINYVVVQMINKYTVTLLPALTPERSVCYLDHTSALL